jgi:hypothetical protein
MQLYDVYESEDASLQLTAADLRANLLSTQAQGHDGCALGYFYDIPMFPMQKFQKLEMHV